MSSERGSEWRKWDLHVHSPESFEEHYGFDGDEEVERYDGNHWEKYLDEMESATDDIAALGVTDYMSVDGYEKVVEARDNGRLEGLDLVLPNIEFRLDDLVVENGSGDTTRINAHVIFSDTLFCRRLLILASYRCRAEEDKDTASAVSDTDDSARCVWVGIGRSGPVTAGSLA